MIHPATAGRLNEYTKRPREWFEHSGAATEGKFRMTNTSNTHRVTLHKGPNGTTAPRFECQGSVAAACRIYPACECESWNDDHAKEYGPGHERVHQDECWLQGWFDNDAAVYAGDDATDMRDNGLPDDLRRAGSIEYSFCDEWIEWSFAESPAGAAA